MKWIDRIRIAEIKGKFTYKDRDRASKFKTCAIGEKFNLAKNSKLYDRITSIDYRSSSYLTNKTEIEKAEILGMKFYIEVCRDNISGSQQIYDKIQKLKV